VFVSLALALAAAAEPAVHQEPAPGGGTLLVVEDHRVPLVWITLAFPVGTRNDFWYHEDLDWFWDFALRAPDDSPAVAVSPFAALDVSGVHVTTHRADLPETLASVRELLANDLGKHAIKGYRGYMSRSWRQRARSPSFLLEQALARAFYRESDPRRLPYEAPRFKVKHTDNLVRARSRLFATGGWVLALAGDVTASDARDFAEGIIPDASIFPPGSRPVPEVAPLPLSKGAAPVVVACAGTTEVLHALSRPGLAASDPAAHLAIIADHVVVRTLESLLRKGRGDSYVVSTDGLLAAYPDVYSLRSTVSPAGAVAHGEAIREALARFAAEGISATQLEQAKKRLHLGTLRDTESPSDRAWSLIAGRFRHLGADDLESRLSGADLGDVNAFIQRFYDPASFVRVAVGPPDWVKSTATSSR